MVPSWTETLLECGVEVVGRTRYCVHPAGRVEAIPQVGGTKDWSLARLAEAAPDLVVLDREENPRSMAEQSPGASLATHVRGAADVGPELERIASAVGGAPAARLRALAARWRVAAAAPPRPLPDRWEALPGLREWVRFPGFAPRELRRVEYLIWRRPWMGVGPRTFAGSMLALAGFGGMLAGRGEPYPELAEEELRGERTVLLASTEPYPFARRKGELSVLGAPCAVVDGECFTWFGARSLRFLESLGARPSRGARPAAG